MRYGRRAVSRFARRNPFTSGVFAGSLGEQLLRSTRRRKISKSRGRRLLNVATTLPRRAMRPPKRKPMRAIGAPTKVGKFARLKRPLRESGKFVKRHFDDYALISRDHTLWAGFSHHGDRSRVFNIAGEAVAKVILAKMKIYPTAYFEQIVMPASAGGQSQAKTVDLFFRRLTNDAAGTSEEASIQTVQFYQDPATMATPSTFEQFATAIGAVLEDMAIGPSSAAPSTDSVGFYLYEARVKSQLTNTAGNVHFEERIKNLDSSELTIIAKQNVKMQNVTSNEDGTNNLDNATVNPLSGRMYQFTTRPMVKKDLSSIRPALTQLQQYLTPTDSTSKGIYTLPSQPVDSVIGHPPPAKQVWTNCRGSTNISMAAGAQKSFATSFVFKSSMRSFVEQMTDNGRTNVNFGGITWVGLEQAFRQGQDVIKVGFNRELHMMGHLKYRRPKVMLQHYDQTDLGDTF